MFGKLTLHLQKLTLHLLFPKSLKHDNIHIVYKDFRRLIIAEYLYPLMFLSLGIQPVLENINFPYITKNQ